MSKEKFAELLKNERSDGPAPTDAGMKRFFKEIGAELKHQAEAGSHEMAAALFRGDAFVMYPHATEGKEDQAIEAPKTPEVEQDHGMER